MARAVLEATAKDKGAPPKANLVEKIEHLKEEELLTKPVYSFAHSLRLAGNDMAHGDFDVEVTPEYATKLLQLMDAVLNAVYTEEALAEEMEERRS